MLPGWQRGIFLLLCGDVEKEAGPANVIKGLLDARAVG
jgi:hypothetical protein